METKRYQDCSPARANFYKSGKNSPWIDIYAFTNVHFDSGEVGKV